MKKKEFQLVVQTHPEVTNIQLGERLQQLFTGLLVNGAKGIACKIFPNEHKIIVQGYKKLKISEEGSITIVSMVLKEELRENWQEQYAFMLAETINDVWNKYMTDEFLLKAEEGFVLKIGYNMFMGDDEVKKYWKSHTSDGYNPDAKFWRREWLRDEHKKTTTSGGKVNKK